MYRTIRSLRETDELPVNGWDPQLTMANRHRDAPPQPPVSSAGFTVTLQFCNPRGGVPELNMPESVRAAGGRSAVANRACGIACQELAGTD